MEFTIPIQRGDAMKYHFISKLTVLLLLLSAFPAAAGEDQREAAVQETARKLYDRIMCPICSGQTIGQSSAEISAQMRNLILKKLRRGESVQAILEYFSGKYGDRILAEPKRTGFNRLLWVLPFLTVLSALGVISFLVRRWSRGQLPDTGSGTEENSLSSKYSVRLEKELKEYGKGR